MTSSNNFPNISAAKKKGEPKENLSIYKISNVIIIINNSIANCIFCLTKKK